MTEEQKKARDQTRKPRKMHKQNKGLENSDLRLIKNIKDWIFKQESEKRGAKEVWNVSETRRRNPQEGTDNKGVRFDFEI